jgi:hypothetical protein
MNTTRTPFETLRLMRNITFLLMFLLPNTMYLFSLLFLSDSGILTIGEGMAAAILLFVGLMALTFTLTWMMYHVEDERQRGI